MTTTVIIKAHCSDDKEVVINHFGHSQEVQETVINDGEVHEVVVYDSVGVNVFERKKKKSG